MLKIPGEARYTTHQDKQMLAFGILEYTFIHIQADNIISNILFFYEVLPHLLLVYNISFLLSRHCFSWVIYGIQFLASH